MAKKNEVETEKKGKYSELIAYGVVGLLTTIINVVIFMLFPDKLWILSETVTTAVANTAAFIVAVLFAYVGNTLFVFKRRFTGRNFKQFIIMRLGSWVFDMLATVGLIYLGTDKLLTKIIVNIVVIVINYILSKFVIFKKVSDEE